MLHSCTSCPCATGASKGCRLSQQSAWPVVLLPPVLHSRTCVCADTLLQQRTVTDAPKVKRMHPATLLHCCHLSCMLEGCVCADAPLQPAGNCSM
jgi:hypothetical protein